jgi:hypothetical protein
MGGREIVVGRCCLGEWCDTGRFGDHEPFICVTAAPGGVSVNRFGDEPFLCLAAAAADPGGVSGMVGGGGRHTKPFSGAGEGYLIDDEGDFRGLWKLRLKESAAFKALSLSLKPSVALKALSLTVVSS